MLAENYRRGGGDDPLVDANVEAALFLSSYGLSGDAARYLNVEVGTFEPGPGIFDEAFAPHGSGGVLFRFDPRLPGPGGRAGEEAAGPDEQKLREELAKLKQPFFRPEVSKGGKRCCVKKFQYPVDGVNLLRPRLNPEANTGVTNPQKGKGIADKEVPMILIRSSFEVFAEYKPDTEDKACHCECCTFRQYLLWEKVQQTPLKSSKMASPAEKYKTEKPGREDCTWDVIVKTKSGGTKKKEIPGPPHGLPESVTDSPDFVKARGPFCFGREPVSGIAGEKHIDDDCKFGYEDVPTHAFEAYTYFSIEYAFLGVIYDACYNYVVRRVKGIQYKISGMIRADGSLDYDAGTYKTAPEGTRKIPYKSPIGGSK